MAKRSAAALPCALAAGLLALALRGAVRCFVPAPEAGRPSIAQLAAAASLAPAAAYAELPPLEDLPMDEITQTREFGGKTDTFLGISFPVVLIGLLGAVSWAAFWVSNSKPAKDDEGIYRTYIGGGELPPEGYTNPLDPRLSEEYSVEDDQGTEKKAAKKAPVSAIV